jgi:hypothetical protein
MAEIRPILRHTFTFGAATVPQTTKRSQISARSIPSGSTPIVVSAVEW